MISAVLLAAGWHVLTHEVLAFAAVGIALSTLDDIVIDAAYFWLLSGRRTRATPLPPPRPAPGWMAIMVPAWDEAAVIGAMLADLTRRLDYPRYRVFVGVYPNDPATRAEVERVGDARIVVVECGRPPGRRPRPTASTTCGAPSSMTRSPVLCSKRTKQTLDVIVRDA